jgi:hypothetical protein
MGDEKEEEEEKEKDFNPLTTKIKLNKENDYTSMTEPKKIITEEDEEIVAKLIRKRKRKI